MPCTQAQLGGREILARGAGLQQAAPLHSERGGRSPPSSWFEGAEKMTRPFCLFPQLLGIN